MKAVLTKTVLAVATLATVWAAAPACAAFVNIVVMSEDADPGTVERGRPIFNAVINALTGEMAERGFRIFDETAITRKFIDKPRTRRRDDELIETARSTTEPPIDVIVIFQIRITTMASGRFLRRPAVHLSGRIQTVRGARLLRTFDTSTELTELPDRTCPRDSECEQMEISRQAAAIARGLARELSEKLASLSAAAPPPQGPDAPGR
jgi:hypothetical protein